MCTAISKAKAIPRTSASVLSVKAQKASVDKISSSVVNSGRRIAAHEPIKVKEVDLYSAFIEVPYTQGAQVRITQCYLQITPYLPLHHQHSPDGASQTEVADI